MKYNVRMRIAVVFAILYCLCITAHSQAIRNVYDTNKTSSVRSRENDDLCAGYKLAVFASRFGNKV